MSRLQSPAHNSSIPHPYPEPERRLLIRIDETETTFWSSTESTDTKYCPLFFRREAGRRFVPVAEIFRGHLVSGFVINADGNSFYGSAVPTENQY